MHGVKQLPAAHLQVSVQHTPKWFPRPCIQGSLKPVLGSWLPSERGSAVHPSLQSPGTSPRRWPSTKSDTEGVNEKLNLGQKYLKSSFILIKHDVLNNNTTCPAREVGAAGKALTLHWSISPGCQMVSSSLPRSPA